MFMRRPRCAASLVCSVLMMMAGSAAHAAPVGSSFIYQGELLESGIAASGPADMQFRLFDSASGGTQVGATLGSSAVVPVAGRFSVSLDFGNAAFNGQERWLEVSVRAAGGGSYQVLSPRQRVSVTPYALTAVQFNGQPAAFYQDAGNLATGTLAGPRLAGSYTNAVQLTNSLNVLAGSGASITNLSATNVSTGVLADTRLSTNIPRLDGANVFTNTQTITNGNILRIRGGDFGNALLEAQATGPGAGWYGRLQARNDHPTLAGNSPLLLNPDGGPVQVGSAGTTVTIPGAVAVGSASIPMGITTEVGGNTPLMNLEVNFKHSTKNTAFRGGALRIDSRNAGPLFQFISRAAGSTAEATVAVLTEGGNMGIGTTSPSQRLEVSSTAAYRTARFSNPGTTVNDAAGIEIYSASSNKSMNLVMGADSIFYLAQASQADGGFNTSVRYNAATGMLSAKQYEIRGGADLVEGFKTAEGKTEPGTLMVIDAANPGMLKPSSGAYDSRVAGVVSGAGGISHGLKMGQDTVMDGDTLVAMTGRVYVKCTAAAGPIVPGDLLTSSELPGHAMKAADRSKAPGATIGKAMSSLDHGEGLVLVLVNLQ